MKAKLWILAVFSVALFGGCTGSVISDEQSEENGPTNEETRVVTEMVTVLETVPSEAAGEVKEPGAAEGDSPEDTLALQYEHINGGNFESAYSLFAQQSQQEVSLEQYRAFFESNAPYSVTDYSFSPAQVRGNSASVDAAFTTTSASGVERLERTQEFVRENGNWRVVMRPEQVAIFRDRR